MNKYLVGAIAAVVVIGLGFSITSGGTGADKDARTVGKDDGIKLAVHKSPTCGCCGVWATYMGKLGYSADIHETQELSQIKTDLGVPDELWSCHTSEAEGYVIEGHIPNEAIERLLADKPDIKGIGMPGMPSGSPGMPGPKQGDFVIYEITNDGEKGEVFMTI